MEIGLYHPRSAAGDGGITRSVRSLSAALREVGYESRVIFDGDTPVPERPNWRPVRHRGTRAAYVPVDLTDALDGLDVLVLHSAWVSYNVVAARQAKRLGVPYVLAPRGAYEPGILGRRKLAKRVWWRLFEQRLVEDASAIHVFFSTQEQQVRRLGFDGPLVVAPNGVEVPTDLAWDGGSGGYLLYVGRFDVEHKGLSALLQAMAMLPEGSRPHVLLCGPDWRGGKEEARRSVARLDLGRWVNIGPPVYGRNKFRLMASALAFLYPSTFEAFGNSAAEAAALGVPVLTGTYPLGQYLETSGGGIAVEAHPEKLADGLLRISDPSAADLGPRGREAMSRFSWPSVAEEWGSQLTALGSVRS